MFTEDEQMRALRVLLNRGFVTTLEMSQKSGVPLNVVAEALDDAEEKRWVDWDPYPAYDLNSLGVYSIEVYSLRKMVELENGIQDAW